MLSNLLWWPWAQVGTAVPPAGPEYHPVGDVGPIEGLPPRRGRRRRLESIDDIEELMTVLMEEL